MKLRDFFVEVAPRNPSQDDYEVLVAPSDDSDGDLWPIEDIEWDHQAKTVKIRMGYLDDQN